MSRLVGVAAVTRSQAAAPVIGVAESPPGSPKNRFLTVGGHPAFETSFWCGTCALLFQRSTSFETYLPPDVLRDRLSASAAAWVVFGKGGGDGFGAGVGVDRVPN